ncbi:MAG: hypothetical protein B7Z52_01480, partial [Burkholderiales bacterium 12-64-5]
MPDRSSTLRVPRSDRRFPDRDPPHQEETHHGHDWRTETRTRATARARPESGDRALRQRTGPVGDR